MPDTTPETAPAQTDLEDLIAAAPTTDTPEVTEKLATNTRRPRRDLQAPLRQKMEPPPAVSLPDFVPPESVTIKVQEVEVAPTPRLRLPAATIREMQAGRLSLERNHG